MPLSLLPRLRLPVGAALVYACLAPLVYAPAEADTPGPATDRALQSQLEELVNAPGGPPGVITVLQRGNSRRVIRAGVADLDTGRPTEPTDHMRIASTAKAFSGAVALRLVDRGALRLEDTIGRRLPALPGPGTR